MPIVPLGGNSSAPYLQKFALDKDAAAESARISLQALSLQLQEKNMAQEQAMQQQKFLNDKETLTLQLNAKKEDMAAESQWRRDTLEAQKAENEWKKTLAETAQAADITAGVERTAEEKKRTGIMQQETDWKTSQEKKTQRDELLNLQKYAATIKGKAQGTGPIGKTKEELLPQISSWEGQAETLSKQEALRDKLATILVNKPGAKIPPVVDDRGNELPLNEQIANLQKALNQSTEWETKQKKELKKEGRQERQIDEMVQNSEGDPEFQVKLQQTFDEKGLPEAQKLFSGYLSVPTDPDEREARKREFAMSPNKARRLKYDEMAKTDLINKSLVTQFLTPEKIKELDSSVPDMNWWGKDTQKMEAAKAMLELAYNRGKYLRGEGVTLESVSALKATTAELKKTLMGKMDVNPSLMESEIGGEGLYRGKAMKPLILDEPLMRDKLIEALMAGSEGRDNTATISSQELGQIDSNVSEKIPGWQKKYHKYKVTGTALTPANPVWLKSLYNIIAE